MSDTLITEGLVALSEAIKSGRKKKRGRSKRIAKGLARDISLIGTGAIAGAGVPSKVYRKIQNMRYSG